MNDASIRVALELRLREFAPAHAKIINELGICHGFVRADVVLASEVLVGFEIKSDCDSLARLPIQMEFYKAIFDRMTLVVVPRHLQNAFSRMPPEWGIWVAHREYCDKINIVELRKPRLNRATDALAIAKLLWRDEAIDALEKLGVADGVRSKPRRELYLRLINILTMRELKNLVCQKLVARGNARLALAQTPCGDSCLPGSKSLRFL